MDRKTWEMAAIGAACAALAAAAAADASETINYSYDARGRLVQVARTGSVNNNVTSSHSYDKADNRTSKTVTGAVPAGLIVVPLGGYKIIPAG